MMTASISGRLAFDPREIETKSGKAMTTARMAVTDDNGETIWMEVLAFGWNAQWLARAAKGDRVAAMGTVRLHKWQGQDGEREILQLLADNLMVPAPRPKREKA